MLTDENGEHASSGNTLWEYQKPRASRDSRFIATTYADVHLYLRSADGTVMLVETSPEKYVEKGRFEIPDHQPAIGATTPVIAGGHLYLRDGDRLSAYDIRRGTSDTARAEAGHVAVHLPDEPLRVTEVDGQRAILPRPHSVFVPTPRDVVAKMLALAQVKQRDRVYDLGSGDGRIVIAAAKKYGSCALGYEIDPDLVAASRAAAQKSVQHLVSIYQQDIYEVDWSAKLGSMAHGTPIQSLGGRLPGYEAEGVVERVRCYDADLFEADVDVVTLYLFPVQNRKLLPRLENLKPGARVVIHGYALPGIEPEARVHIRSEDSGEMHTLYRYSAPLAIGSQSDILP